SPSSTRIFSPSRDVLFFRFKNPCGYSLVRFSVSMAGAVMNTFLAAPAGRSIPLELECAWSENRQENARDSNQESLPAVSICTSSGACAGGVIGIGFSVCGARQLSSMPTCCTQETVHIGAQNFSV